MLALSTIAKGLLQNKSLVRIYQNQALMRSPLAGRVLDVGHGGDTSYLDFLPPHTGRTIETIDPKLGSQIDFEHDALPYPDASFDGVLLLNVLEHVFAYDHLLRETARLLKSGAPLIGFTPFLVRYHPDPRDFFRYTDEALVRMLQASGYQDISVVPIGEGPFLAAVNVFVLSLPRLLRPIFALKAWALDAVFLRMRPKARSIYPMGYYFVVYKK
jgi:SAM-dependent methyltransferase